jgi:transcriptional regulator with XRE-family HTH domain
VKPIYLRAARERKKLTQEQLESKSGVTQGVISRLERENGDPAFSTVAKLAAALDVDPRQLRFGPVPERVAS